MIQLGMVAIGGGNGSRSSIFSSQLAGQFRVGPSLGYYAMGATAQESYVGAQAAIQAFDNLVGRTARIANKTVRDQIVQDYGLTDPGNKDKAMYMRQALASDVANADKYTPVAYEQGFPSTGPARGRVTKLMNFNSDYKNAVQDAEVTYGILPEPVVITQYLPGQTTQAPINWTIPVVVGAGALLTAALLGVFK